MPPASASVEFSRQILPCGADIYRLFEAVGWIQPRARKPERHVRIDSISNHTVYLDGPHEAAFLEQTFRNSTAVYTALVAGEVAGFVRVISDRLQRSVIYDLVVDPAYWGQRLGSGLVQMIITDFGHTQITLGTSTPTMKFYQHFGFESSPNYMELATEAY